MKIAGNDFVVESYEKIRQLSVIESVTKGDVDYNYFEWWTGL